MKIKNLLTALGIGAATLTGCATTNQDSTRHMKPASHYDIFIAKQNSGESKPYESHNAIDLKRNTPIGLTGYSGSKSTGNRARKIASIYLGDAKITKTDQGYMIQGSYSERKNPDTLKTVLEQADRNNDKIISDSEIKNLEKVVMREVMKK